MLSRALLLVIAGVGLLAGTVGRWSVAAGSGAVEPGEAEPTAAGAAEIHVIRLAEPDRPFAFEPADLVIPPGTTVRWVNDDDVFHTVTTSNSPTPLAPNNLIRGRLSRAGDVVEFTFDQPGDYVYYCQPHADFMVAVVRVVPTEPE